MAPLTLLLTACAVLAVSFVAIGVVSACAAESMIKRLGGIVVAMTGAMLALAAFGAPTQAIESSVAVALAYIVIGVALLARTHERYGHTQIAEMDAADAQSEPPEPGA